MTKNKTKPSKTALGKLRKLEDKALHLSLAVVHGFAHDKNLEWIPIFEEILWKKVPFRGVAMIYDLRTGVIATAASSRVSKKEYDEIIEEISYNKRTNNIEDTDYPEGEFPNEGIFYNILTTKFSRGMGSRQGVFIGYNKHNKHLGSRTKEKRK